MRKVIVAIPEVHYSYITLDIEDSDVSREEIKERANVLIESGDYLDALEYSHTMDMDMWGVEVITK
jgi:hypothetical protein